MAGAFMYDSYAHLPPMKEDINLETALQQSSSSSSGGSTQPRRRSNSSGSIAIQHSTIQHSTAPTNAIPSTSRLVLPTVPFILRKRPPPPTSASYTSTTSTLHASRGPDRFGRNPLRPSSPLMDQQRKLPHPSGNIAASMTPESMSLRAEITPWEFAPPPPPEKEIEAENHHPMHYSRPLSSFGEQLMRRRKSTSANISRKGSISITPSKSPVQNARFHATNNKRSPVTMYGNAEPILRSSSARPASPIAAAQTTISTLSSAVSSNSVTPIKLSKSLPLAAFISSTSHPPTDVPLHAPSPRRQPPKFSTVDRTILEELRRNIKARESEFIIKPGRASTANWNPSNPIALRHRNAEQLSQSSAYGHHGGGPPGKPADPGRLRNTYVDQRRNSSINPFSPQHKPVATHRALVGTKHHPYARNEVPYPKCYERETLDFDIWETVFCQQLCGSLTWHVFATPPTRVLDIGCGSGTWVLDCARTWRDCHVVGLDIVPLHPDLQQVGSSVLGTRVTWVQANFLERLPFTNEEFDYVHIKRIALGVPEDKWDGLFEEILRIMKPGGAFELIEEELFFPGKKVDSDVEDSDDGESESGRERVSSFDAPISMSATQDSILSPAQRSSSPSKMTMEELQEISRADPASTHMAVPAGQRKAHVEAALQLLYPPISLTKPKTSLSVITGNALPQGTRPAQPRKLSIASTNAPLSPLSANFEHALPPVPPTPSFLLRTSPQPPINPRDHSLLELIYTEMNASRFINLSPLSLLTNSLGLYFKDVRTHPTLQFNFPPPQVKSEIPLRPTQDADDDDEELEGSWQSSTEDDPDDAQHAIIANPARSKRLSAAMASPSTLMPNAADQERWLSKRGIVKGASPYVTLEDSAFARMQKQVPRLAHSSTEDLPSSASTAGKKTPTAVLSHQRQLPNGTVNMDLRTLNLHLALRTAEITACAESMWETILEYKKTNNSEIHGRFHTGPSSPPPPSATPSVNSNGSGVPFEAYKSTLLELSRKDFDTLLANFNLDMREHMGLETALENRFMWSSMPTPLPADREAFQESCNKWDKWQEQHPSHSKRRDTHSTTEIDELLHGLGYDKSNDPPAARRLSRALRVFVAWKP